MLSRPTLTFAYGCANRERSYVGVVQNPMWRPLVVMTALGCGRAGAPMPSPARPPDAAAVDYEPPEVAGLVSSHIECHAFAPVEQPRTPGLRIYDFAPIELRPVDAGPRIRDRPRIGIGRTTRDLRTVFAENRTDIANCWKFASSRGARPTTLVVGMTIEPLGSTRDLTVTSERADDTQLATCVRSALEGATFVGTTSRPLRLTTELAFTHADQPPWKSPWPSPVPRAWIDRRRGTVCSSVLDDGPVAPVALAKPLEVSDADPSRVPPRPGVPEVKLGCAQTILETDKRAVRAAFESNRGALQRCYAEAATRDPNLAGEVAFQLAFDPAGTVRSARLASGVGDAAFHACMLRALEELWVMPVPSSPLEVNVPFTLAPRPAAPPARDDPAALLAAGHAEAAIAAWTAKLRTPVSPELACRGRAGVLLAVAQTAPWLDDARVTAAIADLARAATALSPRAARACVALVADTIAQLTRARGKPVRTALTHEWLARYAAALPLAPYLEDGATLRWFHAEALLRTPRRAEALELLRGLTKEPTIGRAISEELEARAQHPTDPIGDLCGE